MIKKIILATAVLVLLMIPARAAEYSYSSDELGEDAVTRKWDELLESIPAEAAEDLGLYNLSDAGASLAEKADARYWLSVVWREICDGAEELLPNITMLVSLLLLCAIGKAVLPDMSPEIAGAYMFAARLTVTVPLVSAMIRAIGFATAYLTQIVSLMNLLTPLMQFLCIADGSLTEAAVSSNSVMLAVTVIGNINRGYMTPIVAVIFSLTAITSVCGEVNLGGFTEALRRLVMRMWQILTLFFSFMIGTQSVIAKSADTLASRTARFAIGSMVPVAGGIIAEAYNTLKEGVKFLRSAAGIGGIILVLLILLYGIVPLVLYKATFGITAHAAAMLGADDASGLLDGIKGVIDLLIAIVLYTSMMLVFALVLFARSQSG